MKLYVLFLIMNKKEISKLEYCGYDKDYSFGDGLYIRVRKYSKTWIFRGRLEGKARVKTIGQFPDVDIIPAKKKGLQIKEDFERLSDDASLGNFIEKFYTDTIIGIKNKRGTPHKRPEQTRRYLDIIANEFEKVRVDSITRRQLIKFLEQYSQGKPRSGDVMRSQLKSVFNYALFHGLIINNPMDQVDNRVTGYRASSRDRVLSDDEIRLIFNSTHNNARILRFLLLTGLRIGEVNLSYKEGSFLHLEAEDAKNGKAHWVYLSDLAKDQYPLPICTTTNIQNWLKRLLLNKYHYKDQDRFTCHDLRRTFATRLNNYQRNTDVIGGVGGIPPYVIEKMLNHTLEGVLAVYNRAEYKEQRIESFKILETIIIDICGASDE